MVFHPTSGAYLRSGPPSTYQKMSSITLLQINRWYCSQIVTSWHPLYFMVIFYPVWCFSHVFFPHWSEASVPKSPMKFIKSAICHAQNSPRTHQQKSPCFTHKNHRFSRWNHPFCSCLEYLTVEILQSRSKWPRQFPAPRCRWASEDNPRARDRPRAAAREVTGTPPGRGNASVGPTSRELGSSGDLGIWKIRRKGMG